jgi:hypothetical protein
MHSRLPRLGSTWIRKDLVYILFSQSSARIPCAPERFAQVCGLKLWLFLSMDGKKSKRQLTLMRAGTEDHYLFRESNMMILVPSFLYIVKKSLVTNIECQVKRDYTDSIDIPTFF